jgi:ankyrin repeat protein/serine/threonine protein kinase
MPGESQSIAQGGEQKMVGNWDRFLNKVGYWNHELFVAARNGDLIKVRIALEKGANPNAKIYDWTPLHYATQIGHVEIVKLLLERGANPNAKNNDGSTPLHIAAQKGHVEIVKLLLERGANPNAENNDGNTTLHYAAQKGHVEIVKLLLERGANPNAKNDDGSTPLHIAAFNRHVDVVKILLEHGADPWITDNKGRIPLEYAKDSAIRSLLESTMRNSYSKVPRVPRMQGNEATRVDNGDIERKSDENEKLPIVNMSQSLKFKVSEAGQRDVGKKIARLSERAMAKLGVQFGDYIEVSGPNATTVMQAFPASDDIDDDEIRIDGYVRKNIGVGIGDEVIVRRANVTPANKVVLAPTQPIRFDYSFVEYVKDQLIDKPVTKGDIIPIPVYTGIVELVVVSTQPSNYVHITPDTNVEIKEEPVKEGSTSYPRVPRMQGNEATRVDNGDIERKTNENEKLPGGVQKMVGSRDWVLKKAGNWDNLLLEGAKDGDLIEVQTALEKGAYPNAKNDDGSTPLHIAAQEGYAEIVKILLERGADPNTENKDGWTPLHIAAKEGHVDVVRVLLERGAYPNAKNNYGGTPLHIAEQEGHVEIVKLLLEHGANPNAKTNGGWTPLYDAAQKGHVEIVKLLLEHGANPNAKATGFYFHDQTPLHIAAQKGHVEIVKLLLEHGANPNAKNNDGLTPLHIAAFNRHVDVVKILLEHGADPRIADNGGCIPLDYAIDSAIRSLLESAMRNSYSKVPRVPRMQGNEATRVDNGDIERKSGENEKLPIVEQPVIKNQGLLQIPNYEMLEPIDEGGSAIVYKARRKNDSSLVAIKVPKIPDKDFVKELAVWIHLDHPNIVKLIDYDIDPRPYMVMELMNGSLQGKTFDKDIATRIILDVLSGLKYAHEKGIIHGDIKPSNILLDDNGRAKISDWETAKISDITTSKNNGAFTLIYAAPEQLEPRLGPIDEKTDVYQVCEVFYEILTGRPVFQDVVEVYDKKINVQITLPSSINPTLKDYDKIFLKCLSPKKEDRYSTRELISVLSNMLYGTLTTKTTTRTSAYAFVELAYLVVQLSDNYEQALSFIKKINSVDTKDVISSLEKKIKYNIGTKEDILKRIELLRNQIGLSKNVY